MERHTYIHTDRQTKTKTETAIGTDRERKISKQTDRWDRNNQIKTYEQVEIILFGS